MVIVTISPVPMKLYHTPPPDPLPVPQLGAMSGKAPVVEAVTTSPQVNGIASEHISLGSGRIQSSDNSNVPG